MDAIGAVLIERLERTQNENEEAWMDATGITSISRNAENFFVICPNYMYGKR